MIRIAFRNKRLPLNKAISIKKRKIKRTLVVFSSNFNY